MQSILVSALSLIHEEQIMRTASLPQMLLHNCKHSTLANVLMFCNQSPWWKCAQFRHHISRTPYLKWNELDIGKLWRQSALMPYAFGIICSVSRALLQAFMQNIITVMLHAILNYTNTSYLNNVEWWTWSCVRRRYILNSSAFVWQTVLVLLMQ